MTRTVFDVEAEIVEKKRRLSDFEYELDYARDDVARYEGLIEDVEAEIEDLEAELEEIEAEEVAEKERKIAEGVVYDSDDPAQVQFL